jgi:hypothetical protein
MFDLLNQTDAAYPRHGHIHQQQIRLYPLQRSQHFIAVGRFTD